MERSDRAAGYARMLLDAASLTDSADAADASLQALVAALRGSLDLKAALSDTSLPVEKKRDVLRDIFGATVTPEVLAVVTLMVDRGLTDDIGALARSYRSLYEKEKDLSVAEVTTAVPLGDALRARVAERLAASMGRTVVLRERVDTSLVGGIRIQIADRVLDGSVASQLEGMRAALAAAKGGDA